MDQEDIDKFEEKHMPAIAGLLLVLLFTCIIAVNEWRSNMYRDSNCEKEIKGYEDAVSRTGDNDSDASDAKR